MLTIVWDVDDVLNDLMFQWFSLGWKTEHPDCQLSYDDLTANPPHEVLQVELDEYLASMDAFRNTMHAINMRPKPQLLDWFRKRGHGFRHIALTARPLATAPDVAHWVMRHFGAWIRCVGVVPTRIEAGVPVYDQTKGEFLTWLRLGDVLVDDSSENVLQAAALGMTPLLVAQPWSKTGLTTSELLLRLSEMAGVN